MITLSDVARAANVSVGTASHVLSGKGDERRISKQTQDRVKEVAQKLQYVPNVAAKRLRDKKVIPFIMIFFKADSSFSALGEIVNAVQFLRSMREDQPFEFGIFPYSSQNLEETRVYTTNMGASGVIFCNATHQDAEYLDEKFRVCPSVFLNQRSSVHSCVYIDLYSMGQKAAKQFELGSHKHVAIVTRKHVEQHTSWRAMGFLEQCGKAGIIVEECQISNLFHVMKEGYELTKQLLQTEDRVSAIYYTLADSALGGLRACAEMNVHVPNDIQIITYGTADLMKFTTPSLTGFNVPYVEMVRYAISILCDAYYHGESSRKSIQLEPELTYRQSFQMK